MKLSKQTQLLQLEYNILQHNQEHIKVIGNNYQHHILHNTKKVAKRFTLRGELASGQDNTCCFVLLVYLEQIDYKCIICFFFFV